MSRAAIPTTSTELFTLTEATRMVPGRPSLTTLYRWATKGVRGVRLNYVRVGRKMMVSRQDVEEFIEELTRRDREGHETPAPEPQVCRVRRGGERTEKQRKQAVAAAERRMGIGVQE